jgi:RecA-family ATPase
MTPAANVPNVTSIVIPSAHRTMANAKPENRRRVFELQARELMGYVRKGQADHTEVVDALQSMADESGLLDDIGQDEVQAIMAAAEDAVDVLLDIAAPPMAAARGFRNGANGAGSKYEMPPPLQWLDMSRWDIEPLPERKWAIKDRAPLNQAGLFSGEGGTGKSIIELMKNVAHITGKDWLGSMPEPGPAFYIGAEDDADEIHIRLAWIAKHYGVTFEELIKGGLKVMCLLGHDATLCAPTGKSGKVEVTALYRQLYEAAADIKPKNISIDTLSRAFAGSEIDRVHVYAFAQHMQALAKVAGGSVTVLSHPSLAGINTGTGISGSTAWHGAFRFRQYLKGVKADDGEQPDNDLRELQFLKNQYGPKDETIVLRYQRGLFLPVAGLSSLDRLAREAKVEEVFMAVLKQFAEQGRNVSDAAKSPNNAPTKFAATAAAKEHRISRAEMQDAMNRLFDANKIRVEEYGKPSNRHSRLVPR